MTVINVYLIYIFYLYAFFFSIYAKYVRNGLKLIYIGEVMSHIMRGHLSFDYDSLHQFYEFSNNKQEKFVFIL